MTSTPRWQRLEPDARREQILDCAVRLFGERPYSAVSTAGIAREAGVARGLLNHYFGTKRALYLAVVRRMVLLPVTDVVGSGSPSPERIAHSVDWFLDTVSRHGPTFVAVLGAEGVGADPEIELILAEADDRAAAAILDVLGLPDAAVHRAVLRAYGGLAKATVREWIRDATLTRAQAHLLLSHALSTIVADVLPRLGDSAVASERID